MTGPTATGPITIEPLDHSADVAAHAGLLHTWVTHPKAEFWGMSGASVTEVRDEYARMAADRHHHAYLGRVHGRPAFLTELYDPRHRELVGVPELREGDIGMHVLVAPTDRPVAGFTREVLRAVVDHCFADPSVHRVVVEPDVRNERIARLNAAAGFRVARQVRLPDKVAALSFLTREDHEETLLGGTGGWSDHLTPGRVGAAQRALVAKAIAELSHERLLAPVPEGGGRFRLDGPESTYRFRARVLDLEHWLVDAGSLSREVDGSPADPDALALVAEHAEVLGVPAALLPTYLEELSATLAASAWKLAHGGRSATGLLDAGHQEVEAAMTQGHPAFLANSGRIGFGGDDHAAYAPESGTPVHLVWLGVRRSKAHLATGSGLDEEGLYAAELDPATRAAFRRRITGAGEDPDDYLLMPVHPWQWRNKVVVSLAPDLARRDLVHLGEGPDAHRPQQSIRTFANLDQPDRCLVKTALSVQNMGFMRGLSPAYMRETPAINDWVHDLVASDEELVRCGFTVLRERAAIGYTGDAYHALAPSGTTQPSPYQKMLAALWRESPADRVGPGERLATMASLLHRDPDGSSVVTAMVRASGLAASEWVRRYLDAYLRPLVHCLLRHDLAFMPHGENLVMVVRDQVPVRMVMKDIGEEVVVMGDQPLPAEVERIRVDVDADIKAQSAHVDVMDGFLRFLAGILDDDGVLTAGAFWAEAADCLDTYLTDHPELADAAAEYDLFRPEFRHSCLNRLQLRNTLQMVDLTDQAGSLAYAGTMRNPLAAHRRTHG